MIKIFYNGLKSTENNNKLEKAFLSQSENHITVYNKRYIGFSKEIRKEFEIKNETDSMSDYFEEDHFTVNSDHPRYQEFKDAIAKRDQKRKTKREKQ
jgi:hypothetical protein